ncbi:transcriptional regulator GcvA [Leisingera aquaemixtae]|jgi:LysR family glycine cleavage system transcriptional activator|uniref:transcriptional regulator GcvA n=1 Tax=Leisingera TaxID=191028 RepID=UPI001153D5F2|nr:MULTISPECIES: transcriptional regulator GcvA [Leisingera]QDI76772.1 transcriptional regulator GcvA [Leisingera aquaemixtae]
MSDRLPPLTALRAFDAAARHMSFAKAAEELNVTPAALSFQIKSLEEHLGQPLFRRLNRAVELTEAGETLAPGAAEGFRALGQAWQSTRRLLDETTLTVTAGPALTAKWLAPRLFEFARSHPEIELRLSASLKVVDLRRGGVDVAIRFGVSDDAGLASYGTRPDWLTPVMTPEMHAQFPTPESLRRAPLIFDDSLSTVAPGCDWPAWFQAVGVEFAPGTGTHFSAPDHAIDAACAGLGVALGRRPLIIKDVREGRLVAPFKVAIQTDARFRFLCLPEARDRPQIAAFRDWFFAEIEKTAHMWGDFDIIPVQDLQPQ